MADKEGSRDTSKSVVVSSTPDVCLTPMGSAMVPVPYSIVGNFSDAMRTTQTVKFTDQQAFNFASRLNHVSGDEAGAGGGVSSGVNVGYCKPLEHSPTVKAQDQFVLRHDDKMFMNCSGPDGSSNTIGNIVYMAVTHNACVMPSGQVKKKKEKKGSHAKLTDSDYERAAKKLGVDKNAVKTVAQVETSGDGFLSNGHPKVLFEGHYFHRLTGGQFDATNPTISYPHWTSKYYEGGLGEVTDRLDVAEQLDHTAALESASWGKFQIMGENYKQAGFSNVDDFVSAMNDNEGKQLDAFTNYIMNDKRTFNGKTMAQALKDKDWKTFARLYNGKGYKKNKYDTKLKHAYGKLQKEGVAVTALPEHPPLPKPRPELAPEHVPIPMPRPTGH